MQFLYGYRIFNIVITFLTGKAEQARTLSLCARRLMNITELETQKRERSVIPTSLSSSQLESTEVNDEEAQDAVVVEKIHEATAGASTSAGARCCRLV